MLVEIIVLAIAVPAEIIETGKIEVAVALAVGIFIVYILTHMIEWFQNYTMAKKMTEELMTFQKNHE